MTIIMCLFLNSPSWIHVRGETYHQSEFVICVFQSDDLPVFARIDDMMVVATTPVLSVRVFRTVGINNHLQCYAIENAHRTDTILLTSLVLPEPLSPHQILGDKNTYIALRSHVYNTKD